MAFTKVFNGDGSTFSALYEAENWLTSNGYSYGSGCVGCPRGVVKGEAYIAKWRNLSQADRLAMDGTLDAGRDIPATLRLKIAPEWKGD